MGQIARKLYFDVQQVITAGRNALRDIDPAVNKSSVQYMETADGSMLGHKILSAVATLETLIADARSVQVALLPMLDTPDPAPMTDASNDRELDLSCFDEPEVKSSKSGLAIGRNWV